MTLMSCTLDLDYPVLQIDTPSLCVMGPRELENVHADRRYQNRYFSVVFPHYVTAEKDVASTMAGMLN